MEKENGPSIEDEKNQKHISDTILMEETMDIGLHSGEKSLFNEKDATNMEKLKVIIRTTNKVLISNIYLSSQCLTILI